MKLLISGYGGGKTDSIGLYDIGRDCTGKRLLWSSKVEASSYLAYHRDLLFGITEKNQGNSVYMFISHGHGYKLVDSRDLHGDILCHITYLPRHRALVGSCYGSGNVFSIGVGEEGFGQVLSDLEQGDKSEKVDESVTRAHCGVQNNEESKLYSANIALDRIYCYDIEDGRLTESGFYQLDEGEGPRHIALYPELDLIYVITEYSNRIIVIRVEEEGFSPVQSISTLPEGFQGESFCSTLCFTGDNKFLYAANRGANTIGVFKVDEDGLLDKIADNSCFGNWPRHIALFGQDRYMAITNERSDEVVIAERDMETGEIIREINRIEFKRPSFVVERL